MISRQAFFIITSVMLVAGLMRCSVPKDYTPNAFPNAKTFTSVLTVTNMGNSGAANVLDSVKTTDEAVKLRVEVTGSTAAKCIYIVQASDNGTLTPLPIATTVNSYGTFTEGSVGTYSLGVPDLSSFSVDIFLNVRNTNTALNDVYKIWLTDSIGSFTSPAFKRVLGMATVNLMYRPAALPITFATATVSLGSQSSKSYGSLLTTSAEMAALDSANYLLSPESADIRVVTLTGGKKDNNALSLWLYSPADILAANPAVTGQTNFALPTTGTSKTTYFDVYSGTTASFDNITATTIAALPTPVNKSVQVFTNGIYVFQTQEGKKGLIKIISTGATNNITGTGSFTAQNVTLTVKVLN